MKFKRFFNMKKNIKNIVVLALVAFALGQADRIQAQTNANPPERMTYQGYLVDGNGFALGVKAPTNYDTVFRIYDVKQGGAAIWAEQQTVTVDKGYFSIVLGEGSNYGNEPHEKLSSIFFGANISDRYIGITVITDDGSSTEIAPRLRFLSSPFAFTASQARRLTDDSGNSNFFKEDGSLKLGAGSATTLTLEEGGNATLAGKLVADMPGWGAGLQIENGNHSTNLGARNANSFEFTTTLPAFSFNKPIKAPTIYLGPYTLTASNGNYGSVMTTNSRGGWGGYSINGKYVLMSSDNEDYVGTYNDIDNRWISLYNRSGDWHQWFSDAGQVRLQLDKGGLHVWENLYANGNAVLIQGGSPTVYFKDSDQNDYFIHANANRLYFLHGEGGWNGNRPITIKDGNKVGINTADPAHALDVRGNLKVHGGVYASDGNLHLHRLFTRNNARHNLSFGSDTGNLDISVEGGNVHFFHSKHGRWRTHAYMNGDGHWRVGSDRRLKKNIVDHEDVLERVMQLQVRRYDFNHSDSDDSDQLGVIAQEVKVLFPDLVSEPPPEIELDLEVGAGAMSVAYSKFGVIGIKAIQELKNEKDSEIKSLITQNKELKSKVETLVSEVEILKARLTNVGTQEERLAKLEQLVEAIEPGE